MINGLIQGFVNCLEILWFLPMIVWGLITLFSQLWKFDLLRNGVACIPNEGVISEENGSISICCGHNFIIRLCGGGLQTGKKTINFKAIDFFIKDPDVLLMEDGKLNLEDLEENQPKYPR